jgi:hypothetical protein
MISCDGFYFERFHSQRPNRLHQQALRVKEAVLGKEQPFDTDEYEQPGISAEGSGQVQAGGRDTWTSM